MRIFAIHDNLVAFPLAGFPDCVHDPSLDYHDQMNISYVNNIVMISYESRVACRSSLPTRKTCRDIYEQKRQIPAKLVQN
jgi:hypothetical protein